MANMLSDLDPRPRSARATATVRDWDEIRAFTDDAYMPFSVRPVGRSAPSALMYAGTVGDITLTHFRYGTAVDLCDFSAEADRILVLTTLHGGTRHWVDRRTAVDLTPGRTFVADCSRTDYRLEADDEHLQLNLTVPHAVVADAALARTGRPVDDRLWTHKCEIGGPTSAWPVLMRYVVDTLARTPGAAVGGAVGRNLQELVVHHLLEDWARDAGVDLRAGTAAGPGYVRRAAAYIDAHAHELPTVTDVARDAGVSTRTLSEGFRQYLGTTPRELLRDRRLDGVRRDLLSGRAATVTAAAGAWGYVNMGVFASAYRKRFGENPSETRGR